jgi:hypothetical protein
MSDAEHIILFLRAMDEPQMADSVLNMHSRLEAFASGLDRDCRQVLVDCITELERQIQAKQAEIDRLMLEYCPSEMTPEQIEEWGRHQRKAAAPHQQSDEKDGAE